MINAVNTKKSGLSSSASMQEIAAYITANWTGGSSNGRITYTYHHHNSNCYQPCQLDMQDNGEGRSWCPAGHRTDDIDKCGRKCGVLILCCGKSDGQILSATITY